MILLSYELDLVDIDLQCPGRAAKAFKYLPRLTEKTTLTGNGITYPHVWILHKLQKIFMFLLNSSDAQRSW